LLAALPFFSHAFNNSQWDCELDNDGVTWDCGISNKSSKPLTPQKNQSPPVVESKVSNIANHSDDTTTPSVPRVRLKQPQIKSAATKIIETKASVTTATKNKHSVSTNSNWNCIAGLNGKWDCSKPDSTDPLNRITNKTKQQQTASTISRIGLNQTQTQIVSATNSNKLPSDWNCQASQNGNWDCSRTATTRIIKTPEENQISNLVVSVGQRANDKILFQQMVEQLTENPWDTCQVTSKTLPNSRLAIKQNRLEAKLNVGADYTEIRDKNNATFVGDVSIQRADQFLTADQVNYNSKEGIASASGDVFYQEQGFALHSQQAELQLNDDTGQFTNNRFIIEDTHARGTSQSLKLINQDISQSTNVTYTTCAPDTTDWLLEAQTLELNNETGRGTATNVWVEFFDVPFIYTPYITFPIDDRRQSGLLTPTFGSSDTTGADFSIPYYWNIAPNYDATITPRIMSNRGLMLGGEFRHLAESAESQVALELLNDTELDELRGQFSLQNKTQFTTRLSSDIDLNYISDDDYLEDFGNTLVSSSSRYIKSQAKISYRADHWNLLANIDNYDSIDENISSLTRPHRRLPQLLFTLQPIDIAENTQFDMRNEFVYFDHSADVRAKRLDIQPSITHTLRTPGSFITPKLALRHTDYRLDNQATGVNGHQSRTLPVLSVDSGLFFERELNFAGGLTQTLEPRAYYLYVPYEDQNDIPLFDTSEYDFSFNQLFRDNRFSGSDRVADANQLSLAVTSRFIEQETGRERLRASIGTIIYFDNSDVTLHSTDTPIDEDTSDIVGELNAKITNHWSARSALQYSPHDGKTQKATLGLHYRDGPNKLFNASYRSRYSGTVDSDGNSKDIEQTDLSYKWPISKSWSTVGRWNYSEEHNLTLESFIGLEKDTCCWRFRVIARRYVNDAFDEEPSEGLFFQLELKGLSSFGDKVEETLEEGILGYAPPEE